MVLWRTLSSILTTVVLISHAGYCQNLSVAVCPNGETVEELQAQRLEEVPTYLNVMSSVGQYDNITLQQATAATYLVPNSSIQVSGVGLFPGQDEVLEYAALTNPSLNGERLVILNKTLLNYTWIDEDTLAMYTNEFWQINDDKGNMIQIVEGTSQETLIFVNCSTKILDDSTTLDPAVTDALGADVFSGVTPIEVCLLAQLACPGDLFPFQDLTNCNAFMTSIPMGCDDGEHLLQGNTTLCRFLHATAATIAPLVHCPHVAVDSSQCLQNACIDQDYSLPYSENLSGLFNNPAVIIVAFLLAFVPSCLYIIAILSGRWQDLDSFRPKDGKGKVLLNREHAVTLGSESVNLSIEDYSYALPSGAVLVKGVSLSASAGDIIALMGPSGAGKTTLLKSLAKQSEGEVSGEMRVLRNGIAAEDVNFAYVEQNPTDLAMAQPNLTVRESLVSYARTVALIKGQEYAEGAKDLLDEVCGMLSLNSFLDTQLKYLSGGQQRRWRVAKELLNQPSILLLDEPTSGLDSAAAFQMIWALKGLSSQMITICTIHQPSNSVLDLFSHVVLLQKGGQMQQYNSVEKLINKIDTLATACSAFKENTSFLPKHVSNAIMISFARLDPANKGCILAMGSKDEVTGLSLNMLGRFLADARNPNDLDSISQTAKYVQELADSGIHKSVQQELQLVASDLMMHSDMSLEEAILKIPPWAIGESYSDSLLRLCENDLNQSGCADLVFKLSKEDTDILAPKGQLSNFRKIFKLEKRLGISQWLRVNQQFAMESYKGAPPLDRYVYFGGAVVNAGILALLFPLVETDSLKTLYYFPASLLIGLSIFANLVYLNQVFVKSSREKAMLCSAYSSPYDSCGLRIVSNLLKHSTGNWLALILFFFLYYYVVGWNIVNNFGRFIASFISLKILLDIESVFGIAVFVYLPSSVGLGVTGLWLGWNVLFAGVLLRMGEMLVIWKYWSLYVTPFYHLINTWMVSALRDLNLVCPPTAQPGTCPGGGNLVLEYFGYYAVPNSTSIIVLFSTLVLYAVVVTVMMFWGKPHK